MPIANCFCKKRKISTEELGGMVKDWAELAGVGVEDICINIVNDFYQLGRQYTVLANLYLPTLWSKNDIKNIQLGLVKVLSKYLNTKQEEIFVMTSLIHSEYVVENGQIVKW